MDKSVQITLIIAIAAVVLGILMMNSFFPTTTANTITVNGQASIDAIPDLVTVYFVSESNADTSEEATSKNAEIVDELTIALIKLGFEKKQIQTQNFNVYPDYEWINNRQVSKGYKATQTIRVEMSTDDADKIGEVIDAGVEAGAGISYINFELSQELQNQYKADAMKLAAQDARVKAESVAEGFNKKLGRLISTSVNDFNYYPWEVYRASGVTMDSGEAKAATTDIQPSEQDISASVTAVYKLG